MRHTRLVGDALLALLGVTAGTPEVASDDDERRIGYELSSTGNRVLEVGRRSQVDVVWPLGGPRLTPPYV